VVLLIPPLVLLIPPNALTGIIDTTTGIIDTNLTITILIKNYTKRALCGCSGMKHSYRIIGKRQAFSNMV
jgi:hypothetical protein